MSAVVIIRLFIMAITMIRIFLLKLTIYISFLVVIFFETFPGIFYLFIVIVGTYLGLFWEE